MENISNKQETLPRLARIKVLGIGCGACNVINHLALEQMKNVELISANTQAFSRTSHKFIDLGKSTTGGLGTGMNPELGRKSAENEVEQIKGALCETDLLIIISTLGGGTGSGATPIIAQITSEMNILTIALITTPFGFEGLRRMRFARQCIEQLTNYVSLSLTISNNSLLGMATKTTTLKDAFTLVDNVLTSIIRGISRVLTYEGIINLDFSDLETIMNWKGRGLIGIGVGRGENRVENAVINAMDSPLFENRSIQGAKGVIINIIGDKDVSILDAEKAVDSIRKEVHEKAQIIFGFAVVESTIEEVEITIIATGCD
jgi:cell division protein FtsZ